MVFSRGPRGDRSGRACASRISKSASISSRRFLRSIRNQSASSRLAFRLKSASLTSPPSGAGAWRALAFSASTTPGSARSPSRKNISVTVQAGRLGKTTSAATFPPLLSRPEAPARKVEAGFRPACATIQKFGAGGCFRRNIHRSRGLEGLSINRHNALAPGRRVSEAGRGRGQP